MALFWASPKDLIPVERVLFVYKPMWNVHHPTPPFEQNTSPLIEAQLIWSLNTMLDEHDSSQWYDIVHFEHNLS